jgi:hypothetical protein
MTDQPIEYVPTTPAPVPTPRDVRRDVVAIGRAAAVACGLNPDVYEAEVRGVPVLDVPVRQDAPRPAPTPRPERPTFKVTVTTELANIELADVTDWHVDHGRLDVYGKAGDDGRHRKIATYAPGRWITISHVDTAQADA